MTAAERVVVAGCEIRSALQQVRFTENTDLVNGVSVESFTDKILIDKTICLKCTHVIEMCCVVLINITNTLFMRKKQIKHLYFISEFSTQLKCI